MKPSCPLAALLGLLVFGSGCMSTVPYQVGHDKLKNPPVTRQGSLAMKPLADARGVTNAMQVGGKWAKAKPVYVAKQGEPVAGIVTDALREALEKVGYQVLSAPSADAGVLEGDLQEFWLTDNWGGAVCKITVQLRLRRGAAGQVVWEKRLHSEEDDLIIIPNAMQAAMNSLLKAALNEFASPPFADAVSGKE